MQNAGVKRVVRLRRRRARDRERAFLIEGYRELLRAVEAGLPLESVYHCHAFYLGSNEPALLDRACRECGAELVPTDDTVFAKLSYRDRPDGLLAVAPMPEWTLQRLPAPPADPLYVVATAIEKPGNLGTLLRTADAVGATALIVCDPVTDLFNPNVVRASVGTLFTVPAAQAGAEATRRWLAARGVGYRCHDPGCRALLHRPRPHRFRRGGAGQRAVRPGPSVVERRSRRRVDPHAGPRRLGQRRHGGSGAAVRGAAPAASGGSEPMS